MRTKIVVLACIILLAASCTALAGVPLKINNKDIQEGQMVALFNDDLEGGKMIVSTPAEEGADGAEVSFDKGRTWEKMEREGGSFLYAHRPRDGDKMNIVFMFKMASGETAMRSTNVSVYFQKNKPDQAITLVLEKMKNTYEAEQKSRFMDLFSMRFPNRVRFEESIQNDFYNYNNIRLYYRVDRAVNDPNYQGAIWDIYWERKYMDRSGIEYSDTAHIAMKFNKEADRWLIGAMNGNTIFGSSLIITQPPELVITSSDLTMPSYGKIQVVIHNTGVGVATNFNVQFYADGTLKDTQTVALLPGNSSVTLAYTVGSPLPPFLARVVVDPEQRVPEENRSNNDVSKALSFP